MIVRTVCHGPLVQSGLGEVIAAFDNSAYLDIGGVLVCLLPSRAPAGAIHANLVCWQRFTGGQTLELQAKSKLWKPPAWPLCTVALAQQRVARFGCVEIGDPIGWLGRGEGLTPAGDDRVAGWLIARHALSTPTESDSILFAAETRTHSISRAHLAAAARGLGTAPFHDVLVELLDPTIHDPDLAPLDLIGHTSGANAFQGALAALTEFARS